MEELCGKQTLVVHCIQETLGLTLRRSCAFRWRENEPGVSYDSASWLNETMRCSHSFPEWRSPLCVSHCTLLLHGWAVCLNQGRLMGATMKHLCCCCLMDGSLACLKSGSGLMNLCVALLFGHLFSPPEIAVFLRGDLGEKHVLSRRTLE